MLFKLIYIISLVRGSLHSVLEGSAECSVFTERLYRAGICRKSAQFIITKSYFLEV